MSGVVLAEVWARGVGRERSTGGVGAGSWGVRGGGVGWSDTASRVFRASIFPVFTCRFGGIMVMLTELMGIDDGVW